MWGWSTSDCTAHRFAAWRRRRSSGDRERYQGFNVRHFHQIARREHEVTVSYSFLKQTLQAAGLVKNIGPVGATGAGVSREPASASYCIWTGACTRGSRWIQTRAPV